MMYVDPGDHFGCVLGGDWGDADTCGSMSIRLLRRCRANERGTEERMLALVTSLAILGIGSQQY